MNSLQEDYYGYENYEAWNRALWLDNNEELERYMQRNVFNGKTRIWLVERIWSDLKGKRTEDGVKWTKKAITAWVNEWCDEHKHQRLITNGLRRA